MKRSGPVEMDGKGNFWSLKKGLNALVVQLIYELNH
jgi:hypothetical protein